MQLKVALLLVSWSGCGGADRACPLPPTAARPAWADANADGQVDVNDGVRIVRHALAGGPNPACRGQGDLLGRGEVSFEAAGQIWDRLFLGNATAWPAWDECATPLPSVPAPSCGQAALLVAAPDDVTGPAGEAQTFSATVAVRAAGLQADAWSFGVRATGCTITGTSFAGTATARTTADPPGIVAEGFTHAALVDGGAVTGVVANWLMPVSLPGADAREGQVVLALEVEATPSASGCAPCTLAVTDDLRGPGETVAAVVGSGGWSYPPKLGAVTVEICPR